MAAFNAGRLPAGHTNSGRLKALVGALSGAGKTVVKVEVAKLRMIPALACEPPKPGALTELQVYAAHHRDRPENVFAPPSADVLWARASTKPRWKPHFNGILSNNNNELHIASQSLDVFVFTKLYSFWKKTYTRTRTLLTDKISRLWQSWRQAQHLRGLHRDCTNLTYGVMCFLSYH